jgi:benzoylformate decarboxylase
MTRMCGREAIMQLFRNEGVEFVFGIPGATEVLFMDALEDHPEIKYILGLHEVVAMGMAEGYARTAGKVGVVNLHSKEGLAASLPLLSNSFEGHVPMLVTAGQQDTRLLAQEPPLSGDLVRIAAPFCKWSTEIRQAGDIPLILRRAFKVARQPPEGPVFVSLPQNIMEEGLDFEYSPDIAVTLRAFPDPEAVTQAAELLMQSQSPVIIVGDGISRDDALTEIVKLAELIGARVYQRWMADVNFPVDHPLYLGDLDIGSPHAREVLGKSDVLIIAGDSVSKQPFYSSGPILPEGIETVQIDSNPYQIAKNFSVSCGITGNIKVSIAAVVEALQKRITAMFSKATTARRKSIEAEKEKLKQVWERKVREESDKMPIAVTRLMQEIKIVLRPGTRIVDDCWSCSEVLRRTVAFNEPKSYIRSRGGGSIGFGLPGALGVKLASPDRPVVAVVGDGSAIWSIQSLWTAAHYNIPVTFIVCANGIYRQVRVMKKLLMGEKANGRYLGTDLTGPRIDFCRIAAGMGIDAQRVEKAEELHTVLRDAFNSDKPNLVEVYIEGAESP